MKQTPKFTEEQYEIAMKALENNISEEIKQIEDVKIKAWSFYINISKIIILAFMMFLIVVAMYCLIIKKAGL